MLFAHAVSSEVGSTRHYVAGGELDRYQPLHQLLSGTIPLFKVREVIERSISRNYDLFPLTLEIKIVPLHVSILFGSLANPICSALQNC